MKYTNRHNFPEFVQVSFAPNYKVNREGQILSTARKDTLGRPVKEKILKLKKVKGYYSVDLMVDGKRIQMRVHRIVASVFLKNKNRCDEINHKDGNKQNNSVENLEWCTRSENQKHAYNNGLEVMTDEIKKKISNKNKKFSKSEQKDILKLHKKGLSFREIARQKNCVHSVISNIVRGVY